MVIQVKWLADSYQVIPKHMKSSRNQQYKSEKKRLHLMINGYEKSKAKDEKSNEACHQKPYPDISGCCQVSCHGPIWSDLVQSDPIWSDLIQSDPMPKFGKWILSATDPSFSSTVTQHWLLLSPLCCFAIVDCSQVYFTLLLWTGLQPASSCSKNPSFSGKCAHLLLVPWSLPSIMDDIFQALAGVLAGVHIGSLVLKQGEEENVANAQLWIEKCA